MVLAAAIVCGACGTGDRPRDPELDVTWTLTPSPAVVGPAILVIQLAHQADGPVKGAAVRLEGHMSHTGMAPVLATATERTPGSYEIPFTFTMRGDWVLLVSGETSGGRRIEHRIDIGSVRPSG
jgi:hypothetical protein